MRRSLFVSILSLGCAAALVGCESSHAIVDAPGRAYWLPAAHEAFVSIENDTMYTVVPGTESDMFIHEVAVATDRRVTWLVRLPRSTPMDRALHIYADGDDADARAWVLEEIGGRPSTLVPAEGSVVLHSRTLDATRATVVLEAVVGHAPAGQILPDAMRLTLRESWVRHERDPNMWSPRFTRSGTQPMSGADPMDPFSDSDEQDTSDH